MWSEWFCFISSISMPWDSTTNIHLPQILFKFIYHLLLGHYFVMSLWCNQSCLHVPDLMSLATNEYCFFATFIMHSSGWDIPVRPVSIEQQNKSSTTRHLAWCNMIFSGTRVGWYRISGNIRKVISHHAPEIPSFNHINFPFLENVSKGA